MGESLKQFYESMTFDVEDVVMRKGIYWITLGGDLPCYDFNKEVVNPGTTDTLPEGAVGVRVDDDFWAVAILPYGFRDHTIREIVEVLWPEIKDPSFNPDSKTH